MQHRLIHFSNADCRSFYRRLPAHVQRVVMIVGMAGALVGAQERVPLTLLNASMEDVDASTQWPTSWRPRSHVGARNHRTCTDARTGDRAGEIAFERKETGYFYSTPVPLPLCERVTGEAWVRVNATGRGAYLLLYFRDGQDKYMGRRVESSVLADSAGGWQRLTVTGTVPPGAAAVVLALQLDGPGTAAFDDAVVTCRLLRAVPGVTLDSPVGVPIDLPGGATVILGKALSVAEPVTTAMGLDSRTALPPPVTPVVFWFGQGRQLGVVERAPLFPLGGMSVVRFSLQLRPGADTARPGFRFGSRAEADAVAVLLTVAGTPRPAFRSVTDMTPGPHPRLFAPRAELPMIRRRFLDAPGDSYHGRLWRTVKQHADMSLERREIVVYNGRYRTTLPPALPPLHKDRFPYWTGLSREIERGMQTMATVYLITGDEVYGRKATAWALALAEWPVWTDPSYGTAGSCLDTSHFCHGTAVVYDFCYDLLSESQRAALREALLAKGAAGVKRDATSGWARGFGWPNGFAVVMGGMGIAGAVTLGEDERAADYVTFARRRLYDFLDSRDRDGGYIEGLLYGGYAMTHITPFAEALRMLGDPTLASHSYWGKTVRFAAMCLAPAGGTHVNYCDSNRNSSVYWTTALLRAAEHDSVAQWHLAKSSFGTKVGDWGMTYAVTAARLPLADRAEVRLPHSALYRDIGWVVHRSGFEEGDLLLALRSGRRGSHCQADQNAWQLCVGGVWLGRDPGYGKRQTALHNTLLVNGQGQSNAGGQVSGYAALPGMQYSRHEAADCYPALERFTRHAFMLAGELVVLIDEVVPGAGDPSVSIESRIHHDKTEGCELRTERGCITLTANDKSLRIVLPQIQGVTLSTGETGVSRYAALAWRGERVVPMVLVPGGLATRTAEFEQSDGVLLLTIRAGAIEDRLLLTDDGREHALGQGVQADASVAWVRLDGGVPMAAAILRGNRLTAGGEALIRLDRMGDCGWSRQ